MEAPSALGTARVLAPKEPGYTVDFGRTYAASKDAKEFQRTPEFYVNAMKLSAPENMAP